MKTIKKMMSVLLVLLMCIAAIPGGAFGQSDLSCAVVANAAEQMTYFTKEDLESGYIYFGSYPQTNVTEEYELTAKLNNLAPDYSKWTSYEYYSGTGEEGSMTSGDWMRYTDVAYGGELYRGVKFTKYRPNITRGKFKDEGTEQISNGYEVNKVYWFKFEPVKWRVLDKDKGLVLSEIIIDSQAYQNLIYIDSEGYLYNDVDCTIWINDYETSTIRTWLNADFYNTAFSASEKKSIAKSTLTNNGYYTLIGNPDYKQYDSAETKDYIFLLSYDEALNSNYSFDASDETNDVTRQAKSSDYAKCQGLSVLVGDTYFGNSSWYLRSSGKNFKSACTVSGLGNINNNDLVYDVETGIRPAIHLNLHAHTFKKTQTVATCTENGYSYNQCTVCSKYFASNASVNASCSTGKEDKTSFVTENAKGHTFTAENTEAKYLATAADCVNAATYYKSCSACGLSSKDTAYEDTFTSGTAKGHTFTAESAEAKYLATAADCVNTATYYKSCSACGLSSKDTAYEDTFTSGTAKGHTFTAESAEAKYLATAADCVNAATYYKSCSVCGLSSKNTAYEDTFASGTEIEHSYTGAVRMDSNGKNGTHSYACVNGCKTYGTSVAHVWDNGKETVSATHIKEGEKTYTCICGATYTEPISKLGQHSYVDNIVAPTCTEQGYTKHTCECGDTYTDTYTDASHKFENGVCTACGEQDPNYNGSDGDDNNNDNSSCDCICHKTSKFVQFIYKIVRWFWKLFNINKICDCGNVHY